MSIVSTGREVNKIARQNVKSKVRSRVPSDIDLLNYNTVFTESSSSSDTGRVPHQLHLLLQPSEIDRLVRQSSHESSELKSSSVAKKPGFYIKQGMKTMIKHKPRNYLDDSECVLDTLLPRVPSRCKTTLCQSILKLDPPNNPNILDYHNSNNIQRDYLYSDVSEDEFFTHDDRGSMRSSKDHLTGSKNDLLYDKTHSNALQMREDLLNDEWIHSLYPSVICKKPCSHDAKLSTDPLLLNSSRYVPNVKVCSLGDLTLPFYRVQKKIERDIEKDLHSLGFTNEVDINWNSLYFPKRKDLLRIIHYRLCNHINPDMVVLLDDKEFYCHRILLQCYSEFFDNLKNDEASNRVDISNINITENAFLTIYTWMLTVGQGGFQLLTRQNIVEVLLACQVLKVRDFESQCLAFLENDEIFSEEYAFFIFQNALELKMRSVQMLMVPRIRLFFLVLVCSKDFLELSLESVCTFLQSDHIVVHCELEIFFSAVRWLRHQWVGRKEHIGVIMSCIRYGLMTPLELVEIRKTEQNDLTDIVNNCTVQSLIDEGLAIAVKNSLCKNDNIKHLKKVPPRTWLGKSKTYKTYQEFVEFLKEMKKNPKMIFNVQTVEPLLGIVSNYPKSIRNDYKSIAPDGTSNSCGSIVLPDSGIISKSSSNDLKAQPNHLVVCRSNTKNVLTNTCSEVLNNSATSTCYIANLLCKNQTGERIISRLPQPTISEPVLQTRCNVLRPSFRDQAATIIQAAFRGHMSRLRLLKALNVLSNNDVTKTVSSNVIVLPDLSPVSSVKISSLENFNHLNSETKLREELTKTGSTFLLFQNSILVFGGLDPNTDLGPDNLCTTVYRYVPEKNKWDVFGSLPEPRYYHDVAILKGIVYLAGGVDPSKEDLEENSVSKSVWSLDPVTGIWLRETDMQTERKNFSLIAAGSYLYAIGGHNNESVVLSSVERYDVLNKKWVYVANLEHGRTGAAVCKHNHMIWVAGGIAALVKHQVIKSVECYDPKRDIWMTKSSLRFGRAFASLVSLKGNLYLIGGASKKSSTAATSTPSIDIWDEKNKEWNLKTEMSIARHNHSVASVGSQMVILGGTTTMSMRCVTTVESWCVNRGTWIRGIASLPAPLIGHSAITLPLDVS